MASNATSNESKNGLVDRRSPRSVAETVEKVVDLLHAKGVTLFATIDHDGEAARAGLSLRPTKLLIFGSPKAGTPLMQSAPRSAIDLPLKVLVWEDADGATWVTTNSAEYLRERHGLGPESLAVLGAADAIGSAATAGA
jgi:uncharacterized protein (DUF302 family)